MKVGDLDVLVRREIDAMIEKARQAVRDAGLPQSAVDRVNMLGFTCTEHGPAATVAVYRGGVLVIYCRDCNRDIVMIAVAEDITVIPAVKAGEAWN